MSSPESFWALVDIRGADDCWTWIGGKDWDGYGMYTWRSVGEQHTIKAHRIAYRLTHGDCPANLTLDHLCRNRACCNPSHLDPCSADENKRRGESYTWRSRITHCPKHHAYDALNTRLTPTGKRVCRTCQREAMRMYRLAKRKVYV